MGSAQQTLIGGHQHITGSNRRLHEIEKHGQDSRIGRVQIMLLDGRNTGKDDGVAADLSKISFCERAGIPEEERHLRYSSSRAAMIPQDSRLSSGRIPSAWVMACAFSGVAVGSGTKPVRAFCSATICWMTFLSTKIAFALCLDASPIA